MVFSIEEAAAPEWATQAYLVKYHETPLFTIGFCHMNYVGRKLYIYLLPEAALSASHARPLRRLAEEAFEGFSVFCYTDTPAGFRFARFFGFEPAEKTPKYHILERRF